MRAACPGEWSIVPGSDTSRVLLYFHGGGYCSGSIRSHRRMVTEAGRAAATRTLAIDYRLAPEHPFPAALDDALAAWRFLRRQGIAAAHIAVGGDSAGGGLTIALINRLREMRRSPCPAAPGSSRRGPISPCRVRRLVTKDTVDPLIHKAYLEELAAAYVPAGIDRKDPRVSPLFSDLQWIAAGPHPESDRRKRLLADATRLAAGVGAADVAVTLEIWPHMIHAWHLWNAHLRGRPARAFRRRRIHPQSSIMASRQKRGAWP